MQLIKRFLPLIFFAIIFSMNQESISAQPKTKKGKKQAVAEIKPIPPEISYRVSMTKPWTHLLEVEMEVNWKQMPERSEIAMPVWTPGSYLVREYSRHVQDFEARDQAGKPLKWQKVSKNVWEIETKGLQGYLVSYKVYSNELTVRTNELNDNHAFWNNSALLFHPKGQLSAASELKVLPFGDWKVATGLPKVEGKENTFRAANFDILYDSPFEVGNFKEAVFDVRGKKHRFIVNGEGNYDLDRIARDTAKIIEECYKIFGDLPYDDYLFILNTRGGGGLEHLNSTALQWNRFGFKPESRYTDFLTLVAHEFFHLWNVKRIKPDVLGPFDYYNENYTKMLWVAEGATAYYEGLLVQRAGLMSDKDFLSAKANQIQALQGRQGRFQTSLEEASFDAWIKYYRQDENSINNQISYYDKGEIVNMLLDMEIRKASGGAKSLDDVFRSLYNDLAKNGKNFGPDDYQKACEAAAGRSLADFFSKYVSGRAEIDYNSILEGFGLQLQAANPSAKEQAYLGADTTQAGERLNITAIPAGSPAYEQGLSAGDQIIAIDGIRANQQFLQTYLGEKKPGDKVKLSIFRYDNLRTIEINLGGRIPPAYTIKPLDNPGEQQKALYKAYLGKELK